MRARMRRCESRRRLVESGVLDRFEDKHGPNVVQEAL